MEKIVSLGLFHPSEVANIKDRIMRHIRGARWIMKTGLTLTTLSQPHETITGMMGLGEKRTHETLCISVSKVDLAEVARASGAQQVEKIKRWVGERENTISLTTLCDRRLRC